MTVKVSIATVSILRGLGSWARREVQTPCRGPGKKHRRRLDRARAANCRPIDWLADSLGVTIGTVRRAYGALERVGLVVARVGDGTYVRQRGMERAAGC